MSKGKTEIALGYLRDNPDKPYSTGEIAKWMCEEHPDLVREMREKNAKYEDVTKLRHQIAAQIGNSLLNRSEKGEVRLVGESPRRFRWVGETLSSGIVAPKASSSSSPSSKTGATSTPRKVARKEYELYEPLREYLQSRGIGSQRIDERMATNKRGRKGNIWLYPDVAGMEILTVKLDKNVTMIAEANADRKARFWSFEVKVELSESSVREAYFQAVSNSSWANFGYLVAEKIDGPALEELRMLFSLHGIGVIILNTKQPEQSDMVIPARERPNVDWANCDRIVKANRSFEKFIECATSDLKAGKYSPDMLVS